jgi:2-methylisocitrate lyase-like PEP mutase family enzyme
MDEAITRLKLAADAGADVCFIEGVRTKELLQQTVKALEPKPVSHGDQSNFRFLFRQLPYV